MLPILFFSCVRFDAASQPSWQKSHSSWTQSHDSWCSFSRQMTFYEASNMSWVPRYTDDATSPCRGTVCRPLESTRRRCRCHGCSGPSVGQEPTCLSSLWGCTRLGCGGKQFYHCETKTIYLFIIPYYIIKFRIFSVESARGNIVLSHSLLKLIHQKASPPHTHPSCANLQQLNYAVSAVKLAVKILILMSRFWQLDLDLCSTCSPNLHIWWS